MFMYVEWSRVTSGLAGAVCSLIGTVVESAEAGPGVGEELVSGPEGFGVKPHKARKRTEGGPGSIEA